MNLENYTKLKILLIFIISFLYAIIRYNVFGNVEWDEIPLFITNKAISITIIFLLLFSIQKNSSSSTKKKIWKIIFILSSIHVFISFRLLGPEYYPKFYTTNELNLYGYLTLLFGIVAFLGIIILNSDGLLPTEKDKLIIPEQIKNAISKIIPYTIAVHLFVMGFRGWITPLDWHGYLVPISLIGFIGIIIFIRQIKQK